MRFAGQREGIGGLIKAFLVDGQVPLSEARAGLVVPRTDWLIDPVEAARAAGDPRHIAAAEAAAAAVAERESRSVDAGALYLDQMMRGLGLTTNMSGVGKPPRSTYPIEPGVTYKREYYEPRRAGVKDTTRPGEMVEFVKFADTPMMDWDTPSDYHRATNVTVRHLGDVEELARQYVASNPESMLRIYQTPGGYRAWELGQRVDPEGFQPSFEQLKVDGDYARLAATAGPGELEGIALNAPGFSSRISHKPGRVDWVAQPILTLTGAEAMPDPISLRRVERYHDAPIRQAYLGGGGVNADALEALKLQTPTASQVLQRELSRRYGV